MACIYIVVAVVVGTFLSLQAGVNARLAPWVGHPIRAAFFSFVIGAIGLLLASLPLDRPWPGPSTLVQAPWWVWTGGLFGACYVVATVVAGPRLGAAVFFSLVVVGQMLAALLLDHLGLLGFARHPINLWRLLGVALLAAGVALIRNF